MDKTRDADYHYEMVVNIVAEMVIEYLKTTARDASKENVRAITCDPKEGVQGDCHQAKKVA